MWPLGPAGFPLHLSHRGVLTILVVSQRCNVEEEYALVAKHFLVNGPDFLRRRCSSDVGVVGRWRGRCSTRPLDLRDARALVHEPHSTVHHLIAVTAPPPGVFSCAYSNTAATNLPASASVIGSEGGSMGLLERSSSAFAMAVRTSQPEPGLRRRGFYLHAPPHNTRRLAHPKRSPSARGPPPA